MQATLISQAKIIKEQFWGGFGIWGKGACRAIHKDVFYFKFQGQFQRFFANRGVPLDPGTPWIRA
jgi:hypothetical protein